MGTHKDDNVIATGVAVKITPEIDAIGFAAKAAWDAYSAAVGGRAVSGHPLPTWDALTQNPEKAAVVAGWRAAAIAVRDFYGLGPPDAGHGTMGFETIDNLAGKSDTASSGAATAPDKTIMTVAEFLSAAQTSDLVLDDAGDEEKAKLKVVRSRRDEEWSLLANQVVGGETAPHGLKGDEACW